MATRNFWVECTVDGRETQLRGGPRRKDGGMTVRIYQRDEGCITRVLSANCLAASDGTLTTSVCYDADEESGTFTKHTQR